MPGLDPIDRDMMRPKPLPDAAYLRSVFLYLPVTGQLVWRPRVDAKGRGNHLYAGKPAGTIQKDGYRYVYLDGENWLAARIIWKMQTGRDPEGEIDHESTDRSDNRWANLREATHGQNNMNRPVRRDSASQIKGVDFRKGRWRAQIRAHSRQIGLGSFETAEEAAQAYRDAAARLHGDFARVQ
jgi:hypothetical protein